MSPLPSRTGARAGEGIAEEPERPIDDSQPWVYSGNLDHPTQKAVQILRPLIEAFSQPGQLVLDPFAGSGSTLVAAAVSGRRYLGVELGQGYCRVARERLARVHTRGLHPSSTQAGWGQEDLDLAPAKVDAFIHWLRARQLEGVAGVVGRAKSKYAGELSFAACGPHDITNCHAAPFIGMTTAFTAWRIGNACGRLLWLRNTLLPIQHLGESLRE